MVFPSARKCHLFAILAILLGHAACTDIHVDCGGNGVTVASSNYPYERIIRNITAPEGRMLLLDFNHFDLGSEYDSLIISGIIEPIDRQEYRGEGEKFFPSFLSKRNRILLVFVSFSPPGRGFNITASCYEISETRAGRLVEGNTPAEGFLELSTQSESGGEWMRVCEKNLSHRVAEIVCAELGYALVKEVAYESGGCQPDGSSGNCVRAPICGEYAYRLQDCSPSSTNCTSSKVVKIKCFEPGFIGCYNYGSTQLQNGSIYNSTPDCVSSCRSDTVQTLAILNSSQQHGQPHAQCFCPTTNTINLSDLTVEGACTHPVYNASVGFCNQTDDVMNGSWRSNITWFGSIVHLTCDVGYNLFGSGTLQCVPGVSPFLPQWNDSNDSMPTCKNDDGISSADSTPVMVSTSLHTTNRVYPRFGTKWLISVLVSVLLLNILCFTLIRVIKNRNRSLYLHRYSSRLSTWIKHISNDKSDIENRKTIDTPTMELEEMLDDVQSP